MLAYPSQEWDHTVSEQAEKDVRETRPYLDRCVPVEPDLDGNLNRARRLVHKTRIEERSLIEYRMQKAVAA